MVTIQNIFNRVSQPEYTGKNRCPPCTMVNLLIAVAISSAIGLVSGPLMWISFALFTGVIYLRGYLIPGTPTLTKRYFPTRLLQFFDKQPGASGAGSQFDNIESNGNDDGMLADGLNPEQALYTIGALTECDTNDDLCLTEDFQAVWFERIEQLRDTSDDGALLARVFNIAQDSLTVVNDNTVFTVRYGDGPDIHWPSRAAFIADLAAEEVLQAREERWKSFEIKHRGRVLESLRVFIDRCPACDGPVTMGEQTVDSCCRSRAVLRVVCEVCEARLFEIDRSAIEIS